MAIRRSRSGSVVGGGLGNTIGAGRHVPFEIVVNILCNFGWATDQRVGICQTTARGASIGGGFWNEVSATAYWATLSGGYVNSAIGRGSVVAGGAWQTAYGFYSVVAGGESNLANGQYVFLLQPRFMFFSSNASFLYYFHFSGTPQLAVDGVTL